MSRSLLAHTWVEVACAVGGCERVDSDPSWAIEEQPAELSAHLCAAQALGGMSHIGALPRLAIKDDARLWKVEA